MKESLTICDLLEQSGAQMTFFDMGRRVVEIPLDVMRRFELAEIPYPQPFLQSAWLGILFQYLDEEQSNEISNENNGASINTHNIWFIKMPLDEQGLLQQAARDDFLRLTIEALGETMSENLQEQALNDNPHGFTPREDRMAVFHAKISKQLGDPPSQFYSHAVDYFTGNPGYDQWNFVGLQGIADVAARLDQENNAQTLAQAIPQLPTTPFAALCSCLENYALDERLTQVIAERIDSALRDEKNSENKAAIVAAGIRGLSHSTDRITVITTIKSVLKNPIGKNVEVLAAIAGRAWETLQDSKLRFLFLEALALCETGQQAFDSIMADLFYLPGLRQLIKKDFRKPERSKQLATAIGVFLKSVQNPPDTH